MEMFRSECACGNVFMVDDINYIFVFLIIFQVFRSLLFICVLFFLSSDAKHKIAYICRYVYYLRFTVTHLCRES